MNFSGKRFLAVAAAASLAVSTCGITAAAEESWSLPTAGIAALIAVSGSPKNVSDSDGSGNQNTLESAEISAVSESDASASASGSTESAEGDSEQSESGDSSTAVSSENSGEASTGDSLRAGIALLTATNKVSLANDPSAFTSDDTASSASLGVTSAPDSSDAAADAGSTEAASENSADGSSDTSSTDSSSDATSTDSSDTAASDDTGDASGENSSAADTELAVANVSDYVNIRADKSEDSEILGKLYKDGVATILEEDDGSGWIKITSGSVTGYIKSDYLYTGSTAAEKAEESATKVAKVTTETLRVRAAADINSDVITLIPGGDKLNILEEQDGWYKVSTDDGDGYISADYTDVETEYPTAESTEEEKARLEQEQKSSENSSDSSSKSSSSSSSSSLGQQVVQYALQFLGNPYVWGGTSLTNGADCSGFTMAVYAHFGYSLPHYDASQRSCGTAVASLADAQPGDLICYDGHVAIYMGGGQIVHASNPRTGITTGTATYRHILAIRRIIN